MVEAIPIEGNAESLLFGRPSLKVSFGIPQRRTRVPEFSCHKAVVKNAGYFVVLRDELLSYRELKPAWTSVRNHKSGLEMLRTGGNYFAGSWHLGQSNFGGCVFFIAYFFPGPWHSMQAAGALTPLCIASPGKRGYSLAVKV
jgi:hypothetical protein